MLAQRNPGLAEVALTLRVPYSIAHRLLLTGVLEADRVGGRWFVRPETIEAAQRVLSQERRQSQPTAEVPAA